MRSGSGPAAGFARAAAVSCREGSRRGAAAAGSGASGGESVAGKEEYKAEDEGGITRVGD
jgi:hypothetical protein